MKKNIYIFRHGETDWNKEKRFQGHLDIDINENGINQASSLTPLLKEKDIQLILCSDLTRAKSTAKVAVNDLNININYSEMLREAYMGEAQGKTHAEAKELWGNDILYRWMSSSEDYKFPGGEYKSVAVERFKKYINKELSKTDQVNIGVCSHGALIYRLLIEISDVNPETLKVKNCAFYKVEVDENYQWTLKEDCL